VRSGIIITWPARTFSVSRKKALGAEDHRRDPNGLQVDRVAALAMISLASISADIGSGVGRQHDIMPARRRAKDWYSCPSCCYPRPSLD
jgi:hypothetical protein